jgi:hypothetical protein
MCFCFFSILKSRNFVDFSHISGIFPWIDTGKNKNIWLFFFHCLLCEKLLLKINRHNVDNLFKIHTFFWGLKIKFNTLKHFFVENLVKKNHLCNKHFLKCKLNPHIIMLIINFIRIPILITKATISNCIWHTNTMVAYDTISSNVPC